MKFKTILKSLLLIISITGILSSCSTPKNVAYFQDAQNEGIISIVNTQANTIKIEPFDKISIIVTCQDPTLAGIFNLDVISNNTAQRYSYHGNTTELRDYNISFSDGISGFTVSADGTIDYPVLGTIKVEGMTRSELAAYIKGDIVGRGLIKDPIVTVEFLNTGISVLGEVTSPGRYDLNTDVITLLDGIALAGDLTIQGQRNNIAVIRRNGDKVETYRIDITDTEKMLQSPAYYLKQGDVVYVEPNNIRKRQTTNNGNSVLNVSFWKSVASLLTSAALLIK